MSPVVRGALLLAAIPHGKASSCVDTLVEALARAGVNVHRRTVQRDLAAIARAGLLRNDGNRPARWWRA